MSSSWNKNDLEAKGFTDNGKGEFVKKGPVENKKKPAVITASDLGNPKISDAKVPEGLHNILVSEKGFFIPMNVPSSKNSRQNFTLKDKQGNDRYHYNKKGERKKTTLSIGSKAVQHYKSTTKSHFIHLAKSFRETAQGKDLPLRVQLYFVRASKVRHDFHNSVQIIADLMVEHQWIPDDDELNAVFIPVPKGPVSHIDKENCGVYIKCL